MKCHNRQPCTSSEIVISKCNYNKNLNLPNLPLLLLLVLKLCCTAVLHVACPSGVAIPTCSHPRSSDTSVLSCALVLYPNAQGLH